MSLVYLVLGFFIKIVTGFDDTITNVPVLASVTKTRKGRIAFSIGTFLAISLAIIVSYFFASFIRGFPYYRYIVAVLIFGLAAAIYLNVFIHKPRTRAEKRMLKYKKMSVERFTQLVGIGFIATMATAMDDIIAYFPLFLDSIVTRIYAIGGIFLATVLEILLVIYFSERIAKIKHKREIASLGLVVIGILTMTGLI